MVGLPYSPVYQSPDSMACLDHRESQIRTPRYSPPALRFQIESNASSSVTRSESVLRTPDVSHSTTPRKLRIIIQHRVQSISRIELHRQLSLRDLFHSLYSFLFTPSLCVSGTEAFESLWEVGEDSLTRHSAAAGLRPRVPSDFGCSSLRSSWLLSNLASKPFRRVCARFG